MELIPHNLLSIDPENPPSEKIRVTDGATLLLMRLRNDNAEFTTAHRREEKDALVDQFRRIKGKRGALLWLVPKSNRVTVYLLTTEDLDRYYS